MPRRRPRTRAFVKDVAIRHLTEVAGYVDRNTREPVDADTPGALSTGLDYRTILARIVAETGRPTTSLNSLWHYASSIREGAPGFAGYVLPRYRPRSPQAG